MTWSRTDMCLGTNRTLTACIYNGCGDLAGSWPLGLVRHGIRVGGARDSAAWGSRETNVGVEVKGTLRRARSWIPESFESLRSSARSSSNGRRFGGAAMVIMALTLPYARPLVCDTPGYESARAVTAMAGHASPHAIHAQPVGCPSCDTSMDCCLVPVGLTSGRVEGLTSFDHIAPEPAPPVRTPSSAPFSPLTPPPKV